MSLRARLVAAVAAIAVVLAVAAVVITRATRDHLTDQVDEQLRTAERPARGALPSTRPGLPGEPRFSRFTVAVVTEDGTVRTIALPDLDTDALDEPVIDGQQALDAAGGSPYTVRSAGGDLRWRVLATPVPDDLPERLGAVSVLALPLDDVDEAVSRLVVVELVATLTIVGVAVLAAWWVERLGVRPVKEMTRTATAIAAGDLSHRVPDVAPGTEAGELGLALNQMLASIEHAFDEQSRSEDRLRRFVADASHELRTPITTIRGYAELYRSGALADPAELGEAMRRTEAEAVRMGGLVDDLLHLARLDAGRPLQRAPVRLDELAADAVRDLRATEPARPVTLVDGPSVTVLGDEPRLRQVLANLLGNARTHTPPDTPVRVHVHTEGPLAVLEVADDGPGMAPEHAARAFERFYRADAARTRTSGGSGLGLSIVAATVEALGGHVALRSEPGRGTTVRVALPLVADPAPAPSQL